jgi:hypothetical protein
MVTNLLHKVMRLEGNSPEEITDPKLLARVRRLIIEEHAGFVRSGYGKIKNACIEPGCSCSFDTCGPFREPPVRCTSFEQRVLPLDPELEAAYWAHLREGTALQVRRCSHAGCKREIHGSGPNARYCTLHAERRRKDTRREYARRRRASNGARASTFYPLEPLENQAPQRRFFESRSRTMAKPVQVTETYEK